MKITKELYEYLSREWQISNLPRYYKYFDEWVLNLTPDQISGFTKHMNGSYIIGQEIKPL